MRSARAWLDSTFGSIWEIYVTQRIEDKADKTVDTHSGLRLLDLRVTLSRLGLQDFTLIAKPFRMSAPEGTIEAAQQQTTVIAV